ncbi:MAG: NUDIX hydrolase [Campylobacterota bacterium]|nr:NUDIX hydrolase [Campylobacterota bacterium]
MAKIDSITKLENPSYIKPIKLNYTVNAKQKEWEAVISHDSVSILLWHVDKKSFILVKQFRPPVLNANKTDGMMYELCAGIVDKDKPDIQIAKEEIIEECGYDIAVENIQKISSFYTNVGISGAKQTIYYATCDDSMKVNDGGGLAEEDIEVIYIPHAKAKEFMFDENYQKTPGMMMAFYWFFDNHLHI